MGIDNPRAFPNGAIFQGPDGFFRECRPADAGMSLRDWYAGHALAGILACPVDRPADTIEGHAEHYARVAHIYADAMLAARAERSS